MPLIARFRPTCDQDYPDAAYMDERAMQQRIRRYRRPAESNGQRRAALARWNAHKEAQEATIQRILATPDAELDALFDSFESDQDV